MKLLKRLFQFKRTQIPIPKFELPYAWQSAPLQLGKIDFDGHFFDAKSKQALAPKDTLKHLVSKRKQGTPLPINQAKALLLALRGAAVQKEMLPLSLVHKSLLQAVAILQQSLLNTYQDYQSPLESIWLALNQSYRVSRKLNLEKLPQQNLFNKKKAHIHSMYSECILLALANPFHLSPKDFQSSIKHIQIAAPYLHLAHPKDEAEGIYIDSYQDAPPYHAQKTSQAGQSKAYLVDLESALSKLQIKMKTPEISAEEKQILFSLTRQWMHPASRDFSRTPAQEPLSFCFGIEHTYACLAQPQLTNRLHAHDVINVSPGGLCIAVKDYEPVAASINELIGVFPVDESPQTEPLLGVIRWVKQESGQCLLGIQTLAINPLPLPAEALPAGSSNKALLLERKQGTQKIRSIISLELPQRAPLFLPLADKKCQYRIESHLESFGKLHQYEVVPIE